MKKFMSIMLAGMMVTSAFAINASAIVLPTYSEVIGAAPEAVAVDQQFDGANTEDFMAVDYGTAEVTEDGKLNIKASSATKEDGSIDKIYAKGPILISASSDVERGQYVMEFELTKNDALVGHQSDGVKVTDPETGKEVLADNTGVNYGFLVSAKRPENEGTALEKYGVFVPTCKNTQGGVYKYKIVVDEAATFAALEADGVAAIKTNADTLKYGQILMKVYELAPGATEYKALSAVTSYAMTTTLSGKMRYAFGNNATGAMDTFNLYFGTSANSDTFVTDNSVAPIFNFDASDYTLDNIKVYAPEVEGESFTYDQDFIKGDINVTIEDEKTLVMGTNANATVRAFFEGDNGDKDYTNDKCVHSDRYVMTFDARCDVVGQALTLNMASDVQATGGTHIVATEDILDKWYTYKVYYEHNTLNDANKWAMNAMKIYRKEAGSENWEELTRSVDYFANMEGRAASTPRNFAQLLVFPNGTASSCVNCAGEHTEGKWTVKSIQVVPDTAIAGHAEVVNGEIVADVNIATNGARTAYAVTYNEGMIVDAKMFAIPEHAETFNIKLPYDAANVDAATLYVWDNSATPKLDIVDLVAAVK